MGDAVIDFCFVGFGCFLGCDLAFSGLYYLIFFGFGYCFGLLMQVFGWVCDVWMLSGVVLDFRVFGCCGFGDFLVFAVGL